MMAWSVDGEPERDGELEDMSGGGWVNCMKPGEDFRGIVGANYMRSMNWGRV